MEYPTAWPVPGSTRFRKHEHDHAHICVVLDGGFVEREKSGWRDVSPGTVRVSGAARHDIDFSPDGATCLVMEFEAPILLPDSPRFFENDSRLMGIARGIQRATSNTDPANRILTDDLTTEFIAQVSRRLQGKPGHPPPWLERIREMIHDTNGTPSVDSLAKHAGVHRVHLARTFSEHYGVSVTRYTRSVRIRSALSLLATTGHKLSRIAVDSGYADQSHLTREVRAMTGTTPAALRSMLHTFKTHG
jgi:AraC family transcriptional regulator